MPRRICFDIQSSYFYNPVRGWLGEPNRARHIFRGEKFNFWAASAFDDLNRQYLDFTDYGRLFEYLVGADEIITFNGRVCDLVVLESLVGEEPMKVLWAKVHHDLAGWQEYKLERAVRLLLPDLASHFESMYYERFRQLRDAGTNERTSHDLAGTYRDVSFTYALFEQYLQSGELSNTFVDLDTLKPLSAS